MQFVHAHTKESTVKALMQIVMLAIVVSVCAFLMAPSTYAISIDTMKETLIQKHILTGEEHWSENSTITFMDCCILAARQANPNLQLLGPTCRDDVIDIIKEEGWGYQGKSISPMDTLTYNDAAKIILGANGITPYEANLYSKGQLQAIPTLTNAEDELYELALAGCIDGPANGTSHIHAEDIYNIFYHLVTKGLAVSKPTLNAPLITSYTYNETQSQKDTVTAIIYQKPAKLIQEFTQKGWQFVFVDTYNISSIRPQFEGKENVSGLTIKKEKAIYAYTNTSPDKISDTISHELGHFLDIECLNQLGSQLMEDIIPQEQEAFIELRGRDYCKTNEKEYFAEAYVVYLENKEALQKACPKTYSVIHWAANTVNTTFETHHTEEEYTLCANTTPQSESSKATVQLIDTKQAMQTLNSVCSTIFPVLLQMMMTMVA